MISFVFLTLLFSGGVLSNEDLQFTPCDLEDFSCLTTSVQEFFERYKLGISAYEILSFDPMIIPFVHVEDKRVKYHFTNVNVTGIRNLQITSFKLDRDASLIEWTARLDSYIVSDVIIELSKHSRNFSGTYTIKSGASITTKYNYEIKKDNKGAEHFEIGKEDIICEILDEPEVVLSPELSEALNEALEAVAENRSELKIQIAQLEKQVACKMAEAAFVTLINHFRKIVRVLSTTEIFKNY